jgi:hypothetical protein
MWSSLMGLGAIEALGLGLAAGTLVAGGLSVWLMQRLQRPARDEAHKMRRSLRHTQVQLDQARKNVEALQVEVLEWRRRSSLRQQSRSAGSSRFVSSTPAAEPDAWVLGTLLDGDSELRSGFADTQILQGSTH